MDYRKFWLKNSLGNLYHFTEDVNIFLENPAGLGFRRDYSVLKVGNSELVTSQEFQLTDVTGDLLFMQNTNGAKYQAYQDFIQFAKYKPLELHYQTPNNLGSYHCDVLFTVATKTEVDNSSGVLTVPITLHRLTEWLTDEDTVFNLDNNPIGDGKSYDLSYNYSYSGTNLQGTTLTNNGTDDVGFVLEVFGEIQNMQFTLSQGGEVYGICKINGTYDYVMIDSVERTEQIYLESNGSAVTNPEQYQDFTVANGQSYLTWCKLKVGQSTFAMTSGNIDTFTGTVRISFKTSYATV